MRRYSVSRCQVVIDQESDQESPRVSTTERLATFATTTESPAIAEDSVVSPRGAEGIRTPDPLTASPKRRCWSVLELACCGEDTRFSPENIQENHTNSQPLATPQRENPLRNTPENPCGPRDPEPRLCYTARAVGSYTPSGVGPQTVPQRGRELRSHPRRPQKTTRVWAANRRGASSCRHERNTSDGRSPPPICAVISGGGCITFDESCCLVMEVRLSDGFCESEKAELWDRFEAGESLRFDQSRVGSCPVIGSDPYRGCRVEASGSCWGLVPDSVVVL